MLLVNKIYSTLGAERNTAHYLHTYERLPNWIVIQQVEQNLLAMLNQSSSQGESKEIPKVIINQNHKTTPPMELRLPGFGEFLQFE